MSGDEQMRSLFNRLDFHNEPTAQSRAVDIAAQGRRRLRRRRAVAWSTGVAGLAAVATGVAAALPTGGPGPAPELDAASGANSSAVQNTPEPSATRTAEAKPPDEFRMPFAATRQLLLDTAVEHFDPDRTHLPDESTNAQGGTTVVGTKLAWTVPGETGMGLVQVAVTTPGHVAEEFALEAFGMDVGCELGTSCTEQRIPGTDETVWVAESNPEMNLLFGVMYERADGSLTGVGVYDLFGNNSLEPVSDVAVDLAQAFAFVTDPDLRVDPDEAAHAAAHFEERIVEERAWAEAMEGDFSSTENEAAPSAQDMSQEDAARALQECIKGTGGEWDGFKAAFGVRADVGLDADPSTAAGWVIARDRDNRLLCQLDSAGRSTGTSMFGSTAAKDSPYLFAPVQLTNSGFGMYTADIARVTVQRSGGPEQDAITRDGYWFLPMDDNAQGTFALRGYDDAGELVYDSVTDDPGPEACYTDPTGAEVIREGAAPDPAPETCRRALEWRH